METPDFAGYLEDVRRAYAQPRPMEWVLNPWEYDFVKAHVESGDASKDVKRFFSTCVRAETMP